MRCERLLIIVLLILTAACSREQRAPSATTTTQATATTATISPQSPVQTAASYGEAMTWFESTSGFHFVIDESGVRAEGEMTRPTIGAEKIEVRVDGKQWSAVAGPQGVTWSPAPPPDWGNRIYQRVTLAIDPQKKEGTAQLVSSEEGTSLFRFTDANTGELHEVWVSNADNHIERMKVGDAMELVITNPRG
jgi:hypothetical protein